MVAKLLDYLDGKIPRRILLGVVFPCMGVAYFGMLALAIGLFPRDYDWRVASISQLLYPRQNPRYHAIAGTGVAVTGALMIPFAGYLRRRLQAAAPAAAKVGAASLFVGAICFMLAGLISSHPATGRASVPKLHEIFARTAVLGIGVGLMAFAACGVKGRQLYRRRLLALWSLVMGPAILVIVVRLALLAHGRWLDSIHGALTGSVVWHLGFWEWTGSVLMFLFLGGTVWLLPAHAED